MRIEDTDSQRFVPGSEAYIIESLKWCGIITDEGVENGGPYAPYRQSERKEIYLKYAEMLVASGNAYYAFDSAETLDKMRKEAESKGEIFAYNFKVRNTLETSLRLTEDEVKSRIANGDQWVIRFKMDENEEVEMDDIIRGHISVNTSTLDDKVLYKSADMLPTYHLANIVDDHLMKISHVIRGEEWLPSLPLHYLLYKAFGWENTRPLFAHLPLLLKPQGQGKLSKRDGDKLGFPVFPLKWISPAGETASGYREDGYLPEAFINMLALLGWNPGTEQELFSMDELINAFSLDHVSKSGARFNPEKAKWFNAQYLHSKSNEFLGSLLLPMLKEAGITTTLERASAAAGMMKERAVFPNELLPLTLFLFEMPHSFDDKSVRKFWKEDNIRNLAALSDLFSTLKDSMPAEETEQAVRQWITENNIPLGQLMNTLRISIIGTGSGPDIFKICEFIGKTETCRRIKSAIESIKVESVQ